MKVNSTNQILVIDKKNVKTQEKKNVLCESSKINLNNTLKINFQKSGIPATLLKIPSSSKKEEKTELDKDLDTTSKVGMGVGAVGGAVTLPGEVINNVGTVKKVLNSTIAGSVINATISSPNSVKEKVFITVAKASGKAIRATDSVAKLATKLNHVPTYNIVAGKVLPTANAVVSGIAIYTNMKKFDKSVKEGNKLEMLKSGTQIVLNGVSGVGGFVKGKGQVISGVAGAASLFADFAFDKTAQLLNKK